MRGQGKRLCIALMRSGRVVDLFLILSGGYPVDFRPSNWGAVMPDSYTTVTETGFLSRIGSSILGFFLGPILVIAAIVLLSWNEGRAVHRDPHGDVVRVIRDRQFVGGLRRGRRGGHGLPDRLRDLDRRAVVATARGVHPARACLSEIFTL